MQTITFGPGTPARCNRCDARSPLPKAVTAVRENSAAYRIQDFATLDCGHFDCHWVYAADVATSERIERAREVAGATIGTYGIRGYEVQRNNMCAFVANDSPNTHENYAAALAWSMAHPEVTE
jgi:hypothetical protein